MRVDGPEYVPEIDNARLSSQLLRVKELMLDGVWRSIDEISAITTDPPASVSAQLRHLRKSRFGSYVVDRRPSGDRKNGLFHYRLQAPGTDSEFALVDRKSKLRQALEAVWKHPETTRSIKETIVSVMKG